MKFEIMNPSDKAYIEADDFETACIATMMISESYGLEQVNGELEMPMPFFMNLFDSTSFDDWFKKQFKRSPVESYKNLDKKNIKKALESVHLVGERSSLNDFTKYAHALAKQM